jgi:hypothetical protein
MVNCTDAELDALARVAPELRADYELLLSMRALYTVKVAETFNENRNDEMEELRAQHHDLVVCVNAWEAETTT